MDAYKYAMSRKQVAVVYHNSGRSKVCPPFASKCVACGNSGRPNKVCPPFTTKFVVCGNSGHARRAEI